MAKQNFTHKTFQNKKAFHDYFIEETFEAGVVLSGGEVKSIRAGRLNLKDSFIKIIKGEMFLLNCHISYLETTHASYRQDETRSRKLLMHRKQIDKLLGQTSTEGMTLVPTKIYFDDKNFVKVQVGLAKGKDLHDKRESLKEKDLKREMQNALKNWK